MKNSKQELPEEVKAQKIPIIGILTIEIATRTGGQEIILSSQDIFLQEKHEAIRVFVQMPTKDTKKFRKSIAQAEEIGAQQATLDTKFELIGIFHATLKDLYGKEIADEIMKRVNRNYESLNKKGQDDRLKNEKNT